MGITQVPPVPTPTAKGEIVVGTATGPTRLPVSTTANQNLITDPTTATGLKYGISGLAASHTSSIANLASTTYTITSMSYTNPNVTVTTSTNHNFLVGHNVWITGCNNATQSINTTSANITAVTANTFTYNYGTTNPGALSAGGTVGLTYFGLHNGGKYLNGTFVLTTDQSSYLFSTDNGATWNYGQVPTGQNSITDIDHDGTTWVFACATAGLWRSTTLASNSWTRCSTFGGFYANGVKWCGGSTNRWVASGSSDSGSFGAGCRIETSSAGAVTWTSQTIGGINSYAGHTIGFDGNSTIVIFHGSTHAITVGTGGGASWTGYTGPNTIAPSGAGVRSFARTANSPFGYYNPVSGKWIQWNVGGGGMRYGMTTAGSPATFWTGEVSNTFPSSAGHNDVQNNGAYSNNLNNIWTIDTANSRLMTYSIAAGQFTVYSFSLTATAVAAFNDTYPLIGIQTSTNLPNTEYPNTYSGNVQVQTNPLSAVYGNGRWVLATNTFTSSRLPSSVMITTLV